ncbi:glycosyltransferase [Blastococcus haudaquaticus]|uniref:Glycosyltransferase, GT2 family n=1 Tax=Blastococcus haudaquaticus TaxID=1938745 RepID=A0A286GXV0_9ACTN|nr:Glycosyltransferase, GT2 family [Blastococcus haudaquaticus]
MQDWDVIVVLHNSELELGTIWPEIPAEVRERVCAVDNASTDNSYPLARKLFGRVIRTDNGGLSRGNNLGLRNTSARFVLFLNPDVRLTRDGLRTLESTLRQHRSLVAPRLVGPDGEPQANGRGLPFLAKQVRNRLSHRSNEAYNWPPLGPAGEVPWVLGAAIACERETITGLGGWPKEFFLYYEDAELCMRAWKHGVPVLLNEEVRWIHAWARQSHSWRSVAFRLHLRSAVRFFLRHPGLLVGRRPSGLSTAPVSASSRGEKQARNRHR